MPRIGSLFVFFWFLSANAADVNFSASLNQSEIGSDESVTLNLEVETSGGRMSVSGIDFDAPDFREINSYQTNLMNSVYENGKITVRNTKRVSKILRPTRKGAFTIKNIRARVNGKVYRATDLKVKVVAAGSGSGRTGQAGQQQGLGGFGGGYYGQRQQQQPRERERTASRGDPFFLRAETSKSSVYKGEQVMVSYYLYRRVRVFNVEVTKYPVLTGFLREDISLPVLRRRQNWERVKVKGVPYYRALLARYAAYPLKSGKLEIDPMKIKANYYSRQGGKNNLFGDDDPFFQYFQQLAPQLSSRKSPVVPLNIKKLPIEGRPTIFSGGVGNFSVVSAVDRYEVKANEPVTLTVKIEGRGNVAAITEPKAIWPTGVELYESKGKAQTGKNGIGQKVFEYLLIPRSAGKFSLPPLEFAFFDPKTHKYITKTTDPVSLDVSPAAPGTGLARKESTIVKGTDQAQADIRYLRPPSKEKGSFIGQPFWRWSYWVSALAFLLFSFWVAQDIVRRRLGMQGEQTGATLNKKRAKEWRSLQSYAAGVARKGSTTELTDVYERISALLFQSIDDRFAIGARSFTRTDLRRVLIEEKKLDETLWKRIEALLVFVETVRYASTGGSVSEESARRDLRRYLAEGENLSEMLANMGLTSGVTNNHFKPTTKS